MIQVVGGVAVGAAAMMLAPSIISVFAGVVRPVAKTLVKGGLLAFESGVKAVQQSSSAIFSAFESTKAVMVGAVESLEDLAAEAKAELAESQKEPVKARKKKEA